MIAGGRGVEGAFDGGVGVRGGEGGFQIAGVALREEFEVDDVGDGGGESIEQRADQHGGGYRGRGFGGDAGVEPGEGRFGFGVTRVVEGQGVGGDGMSAGENFVEPFGYAFAGGGVDAAGGGRQSGSPANEQVGFGLLVGVEELEIGIGEGCGGVQHDGEGGDAETIGVVAQERAEGGGDDVGTTAHGFGEDDFGGADGEAVEGIDEIWEAAAEAASGDLVGGEVVGLHEVGVNEIVALIVEDDGYGGSAALEEFGGG